jgi:hypothetical protein
MRTPSVVESINRRLREVDDHPLRALCDRLQQLLLELRRGVQIDLAAQCDQVGVAAQLLRLDSEVHGPHVGALPTFLTVVAALSFATSRPDGRAVRRAFAGWCWPMAQALSTRLPAVRCVEGLPGSTTTGGRSQPSGLTLLPRPRGTQATLPLEQSSARACRASGVCPRRSCRHRQRRVRRSSSFSARGADGSETARGAGAPPPVASPDPTK